MARRNFPDVRFEVAQHGGGWAIWLVITLGGVLGVFAFTALIVSFLFEAQVFGGLERRRKNGLLIELARAFDLGRLLTSFGHWLPCDQGHSSETAI